MRGVVIKSTGNLYKVIDSESNTIINCHLKGKIRLDKLKSTNPIAVGDNVLYELDSTQTAIITEICERKNYIIRKSTNLSKQSHILAANIDIAFIIVTITQPKTLLSFIDRFLVTAEAYSIPAQIIVNKTDIYSTEDFEQLQEWKDIYKACGYEIIETSIISKQNIEDLRAKIKNKTVLFSGNSGVGKSSLLSELIPGLDIQTHEISQSHQTGMHTTTFAEMHPMPQGGFIIDTPGIKAFGLYDIDKDEISHFFPEIFTYSKDCQYYNCTHIHEPGCMVVQKTQEGIIPISRYQHYMEMFLEDEKKHR